MLELVFFVVVALSFSLTVFSPNLDLSEELILNAEPKKLCLAANPKGEYLNVLSNPMNGDVVSKLKNGTMVRVGGEFMEPKGDFALFWLQISVNRKGKWEILGWVLSNDLDCSE